MKALSLCVCVSVCLQRNRRREDKGKACAKLSNDEKAASPQGRCAPSVRWRQNPKGRVAFDVERRKKATERC